MIVVSDGQATAQLQFTITVQAAPTTPPANRPPTITGTPATSVTAGSAYTFSPVGSDPDGNTLTYSIQNQPSWASFSTTTGRLSGTPTTANVGTSAIASAISVSDGTASASLASFTIQVVAPANRAPTISGTPLLSINVLTAYSFQPSASDPDGNTLTFSIQNRPAWATFSTSTGRLSGTPALTDVAHVLEHHHLGVGRNGVGLAARVLARGAAGRQWHRHGELDSRRRRTPTARALTDLAGYRIAYGRAADALDQSATVNNAGLTHLHGGQPVAGHVVLRGVRRQRRRASKATSRTSLRRPINYDQLNARSRRASVRAWPSSASVASMGGDTVPPDTATRSGCATLPRPSDFSFASAFERRVHRGRGPVRRAPRSACAARPASAFASAVRCFSAAFASSVTSSPKKNRLFSAISFSVLARSRCASDDAFEQRVVLRIDAEPRELPAQVRHDVLGLRLASCAAG